MYKQLFSYKRLQNAVISHPNLKVFFVAVLGIFSQADLSAQNSIGFPEPNDPNLLRDRGSQSVPGPVIVPLAATQEYDFGPISVDEQIYIEYINRARKDPQAEGEWLRDIQDPDITRAVNFFGTDLSKLLTDEDHGFQTFEVGQPLAPNSKLGAAAQIHNMDMFENTYQGHFSDSGENARDRIDAQGYNWSTWGENVFSSSENNLYGHAGFQIDWGNGPDGIQNPPGHRISIHKPSFKEIGIAVFNGSKAALQDGNQRRQDVGPQLVTQVFGAQQGNRSFLTGVAYYDLNGNQFYDEGEGIPGVRVESLEGTWFSHTAESGGYSIPSNGNGSYTMKFSSGSKSEQLSPVTISGSMNQKVDLILDYSGVELTTPANLSTLHDLKIQYEDLFGASSYIWRLGQISNGPFLENADSGVSPFEASISGDFNIITTRERASGSRSFHLFHQNPPEFQTLTWKRIVKLNSGAQLRFKSKIMAATPAQVALAQIRPIGSGSWTDLWSQAGVGQPGDSSFKSVSIPLTAFEGENVELRFAFRFNGGSFFPGNGNDPAGLGWYFDDVEVLGSEEFVQEAIGTSSSGENGFMVRPQNTGTYILQVQPLLQDNSLPWAGGKQIVSIAAQVDPINNEEGSVEIVSSSISEDDKNLLIQVLVTGDDSPSFQVSSSPSVTGPFEPIVTFSSSNSSGSEHILSIPVNTIPDTAFFRIGL